MHSKKVGRRLCWYRDNCIDAGRSSAHDAKCPGSNRTRIVEFRYFFYCSPNLQWAPSFLQAWVQVISSHTRVEEAVDFTVNSSPLTSGHLDKVSSSQIVFRTRSRALIDRSFVHPRLIIFLLLKQKQNRIEQRHYDSRICACCACDSWEIIE